LSGQDLRNALAPKEKDEGLKRALRELVLRLDAQSTPYRNAKVPRQLDEPAMREFAHSSRILLPLADALLFSLQREDHFPYRFGYLLRFVEAVVEVAELLGAEKLHHVSRVDGAVGAKKVKEKKAKIPVVRWSELASEVIIRIVGTRWTKSKRLLATRLRLKYPQGAPELPASDKTLVRLIDKMAEEGKIKLDK
jgi:hypothetical protein